MYAGCLGFVISNVSLVAIYTCFGSCTSFACHVIWHVFLLSSDDCFEKQLFQKFLSGKLSVTNSLDPDQADIVLGLI